MVRTSNYKPYVDLNLIISLIVDFNQDFNIVFHFSWSKIWRYMEMNTLIVVYRQNLMSFEDFPYIIATVRNMG